MGGNYTLPNGKVVYSDTVTDNPTTPPNGMIEQTTPCGKKIFVDPNWLGPVQQYAIDMATAGIPQDYRAINAMNALYSNLLLGGSFEIEFISSAGQTSYQNDALIGAILLSHTIEGMAVYIGSNPGEQQPFDSVTGTVTWNEAIGAEARHALIYKVA